MSERNAIPPGRCVSCGGRCITCGGPWFGDIATLQKEAATFRERLESVEDQLTIALRMIALELRGKR